MPIVPSGVANPEKKRTFTPIDDGLASFKGLTAEDVLIHARIDRYEDAYPSYEYLAKFARCSRRSAIRSVQKLEKLGLLSVERRKETTCLFTALKPWERKEGVTQCHPKIQGFSIPEVFQDPDSPPATTADLVSWGDRLSLPQEVAA